MPFQPTNFPALFTGVINPVTINSPFPDSQLIVDMNQPWAINVSWNTSGFLASAIGGTWQVKAYLESIGQGFEGQVGATVPVAAVGPLAKNAVINVPAPSTNPQMIEGAYKLVVTLTHLNPNPTGIAGYEESTIVQFVKP